MIAAQLLRNAWRSRRPPAPPAPDAATVTALSQRLREAAQVRLGRSLVVFFLDAGGCNGCALEAAALAGTLHDLARAGLSFAASPRHADVLLVGGPVTRNMQEALLRAHAAMPDPKSVVALGDCGIDAGVFKGAYGVLGPVADVLPVDLSIRGCPPTPAQILDALRALLAANATT